MLSVALTGYLIIELSVDLYRTLAATQIVLLNVSLSRKMKYYSGKTTLFLQTFHNTPLNASVILDISDLDIVLVQSHHITDTAFNNISKVL